MAAVKNCRVQLTSADRSAGDTNRPLAEAMLLRAGNDYREHAERFTADDCHVAEHFHLLELGTGDYWDDLTTTTAPAASSCLLYTSPSPRDKRQSRMPSSA